MFYKAYLFFFVLSAVGGWLSVLLISGLWGYQQSEIDQALIESVIVFSTYLTLFILCYRALTALSFPVLRYRFQLSQGGIVLCSALYCVAYLAYGYVAVANFGYASLEGKQEVVGGTILSFLLTWLPLYMVFVRHSFGGVLIVASAVLFAVSYTRFNIAILFLGYYFLRHGEVPKRKLLIMGAVAATLFVAVSTLRVDNHEDDSLVEMDGGLVALTTVASNVGAEWRDGVFGLIRLPRDLIDDAKSVHVESILLPGIPLIGYLPFIDMAELRRHQLYHHYVKLTGLDQQGFTGIRVGMMWEMYYFYSYFGLLILAILNAILLRCCVYIKPHDSLSFTKAMFGCAVVYSVIGQSTMYLGVFIQYAIYSVLLVACLRLIAATTRKKFS